MPATARATLLAALLATAYGFTLGVRAPSISSPAANWDQLMAVRMAVNYDKTKEGEYPHPTDDDYKFGDITKRVIRDMTGNTEYEFGDGAKALSSATQDSAEKAAAAVIDAGGTAIEAGAAAKKVLDDSGYQFGDLTKGAIKGWEEIVRDASGNDEYKFGDVTKNAMKGLFGFMEKGAAAAKQKLEDADEK